MLEDENCLPMVAEQTTSCCCQGNDESAESCSTTQGQGGESLKRSVKGGEDPCSLPKFPHHKQDNINITEKSSSSNISYQQQMTH